MPHSLIKAEKDQIAARLRLTRQALRMTQRKFSDAAGINANAYSMYETATRVPSIEAALNLSAAHKLTLDWIYKGDASNLPYKLAHAINAITKFCKT